jgi:hypothetical protein
MRKLAEAGLDPNQVFGLRIIGSWLTIKGKRMPYQAC